MNDLPIAPLAQSLSIGVRADVLAMRRGDSVEDWLSSRYPTEVIDWNALTVWIADLILICCERDMRRCGLPHDGARAFWRAKLTISIRVNTGGATAKMSILGR
ncbi:hypothetical protein [Mariniblastus fucicola]|uniref:hypothetical protein n=1 Tax=Mariniblastus fucicola TaxID=980251 RepID=UPI0011DF1C09|nr:hypothetical protein [Mariniblastus fucicola]